jgi:hypothetical protein
VSGITLIFRREIVSLQNLPNLDLILAAAVLMTALVAARLAFRRRRPKFLYGDHQSVAQIQQARHNKMFAVRDDFENRHFSPSRARLAAQFAEGTSRSLAALQE